MLTIVALDPLMFLLDDCHLVAHLGRSNRRRSAIKYWTGNRKIGVHVRACRTLYIARPKSAPYKIYMSHIRTFRR